MNSVNETNDVDWTFVDVQGFKSNDNKFIVKEFTLLQKKYQLHFVVKSTCAFNDLSDALQNEAVWLFSTYHGLTFDVGNITIAELAERTLERVNRRSVVVVVKGIEKVQWVKDIYKDYCNCTSINCVNIEDFDCEFRFTPQTRRDIQSRCLNHEFYSHQRNHYHCSRLQARQLQTFHMNKVTNETKKKFFEKQEQT